MRNVFRKDVVFLLASIFFLTTAIVGVNAQEKSKITVEWLYSQEGKNVGKLPSFCWLKDGTALIYYPLLPKKERTILRLNPETGQQTPVLDAEKALKSLKGLLTKKKGPKALPWPLAFDGQGKRALYLFEDDIFLLDLEDSKFSRITVSKAKEKSPRFSPNGQKVAFVRENNLYVYDIESKQERQLTRDGSSTILNGTLSWVYWEEVFGRQDIGYWWSEDSQFIAFLHTDESPVSLMHFVDFKPFVPRVLKQRYPKAGTANPKVKLGIVDINERRITWVDFNNITYEYLVRVKWLPDNKRLSVETLNRAQTELNLYFVDIASGQAAHILKETDPAWVNIHDDLYFLKDGQHFIWASERDGYNHLYLYQMDGKLVNQITKGSWAIHSAGGGVYWLRQAVVAIDNENNFIYFTALKKSSIERHLYRIKFDGSQMERLTKEDGTHRITFSLDSKYYFDAYSNISTLPSLALYKNNGQLIKVIAKPRTAKLAKFDVQYSELLTIPARDGFPMPAELLKPKDFNPNQKYPVIIYVYGGPSAPTVFNAWRSSILFDQILLDKGYLVLRVDNRSAAAISKKLENIILKDGYGTEELSDLLDAVHWLKKQTFVDPKRIGIWGWSGGGTFTLLAMTHSKEFKAGIAVAAVTDWRYYDTIWAEAFMKRPEDNLKGYEKTSLVKRAKNLHGRLLLVHGTYDDNVHPQNCWSFINELIKAGKMFDLMIYPMRKHGISDDPARIHLYNKMVEFWVKNL